MKKTITLMILSIILIPTMVNAEVGAGTPVGIFNDEEPCLAELELNEAEANKNATTGYYLTCIEITCVNSKVKHTDKAPMLENVTCGNSNKNPFVISRQSGISDNGELEEGKSCLMEEDDDGNVFVTTYATVKSQYNCAKTSTGENYGVPITSSTTTPTTSNISTSTTTAKPEENIKSPETGINTYYLALTILAVILSGGVYIINKKNLFKKI